MRATMTLADTSITMRIILTILQHPEIIVILLILCLAGLIYCLYSLVKIYKDERRSRVEKYLNRRNWSEKR